jgi:pSer/pThr/pTyr-binding forkhead associated (FHA) protein
MNSPFYASVISGIHSGKKFNVAGELTLGRNATNTLSFIGVDAGIVSDFHAVLNLMHGRLLLTDKNSTNGTYVNGNPITQTELFHNDIVSLGQNGPKLRILKSENILTKSKNPDIVSGPGSPGNSSFNQSTQAEIPGVLNPNAGNYTMDLAKRIYGGKVEKKELGKLFQDKQRLDRIENASLLEQGQMGFISSAAETYRQSRKRAIIVITLISLLACCMVMFLLIKNINYKQKLVQQKIIVEKLSNLKAEFNNNIPNSSRNEEEKLILLAKIRTQERLLTKLRDRLSAKDLVNLYPDPLGREIHTAMMDFGETDYIVPDIFIKQVRKHLLRWKKNPAFLRKTLKNKEKNGAMILRELSKANLPPAFLYLAMHESGLDSTIISRAGARGIWQFMPKTARTFGLRVHKNWRKAPVWVDERTNPVKSTRAAIKYIKVLLGQFGTVPLAMAAYNAGEGRISRELRKIDDPINNRDFWYIYRSGTLARETNEYVPKIVATMLIVQNRHKYGF